MNWQKIRTIFDAEDIVHQSHRFQTRKKRADRADISVPTFQGYHFGLKVGICSESWLENSCHVSTPVPKLPKAGDQNTAGAIRFLKQCWYDQVSSYLSNFATRFQKFHIW